MESQIAREKDSAEVLYLAFELSQAKWKLGFSDGKTPHVREVTIQAGDLTALEKEIGKSLMNYGLEKTAKIRSCYEAGREGFWPHWALSRMGIENLVVDAASIEVNRRQKRAKTDRMDVKRLMKQLLRYWRGERDAWSVVRVPSREAEDARQLHRGLDVLKEERKQHRVRMQSLLFTQGIHVKVGARFSKKLETLRCWDGESIPPVLKQRLEEEYQRLLVVEEQIRKTRAQQKDELKTQQKAEYKAAALEKVKRLQQLVGIGMGSSWVFVMEMFGWRTFKNRREVGGSVGLTGTPFNSGDSAREQGISRVGNEKIRQLLTELAWSWLRFQPDSQLSRWFQERFGGNGMRTRRIGIVGVARKLIIALWRWVEFGTVPEGARMRAAA